MTVDVYCDYKKRYQSKVEKIENGHVYVDRAQYYEDSGLETFGGDNYFIKPADSSVPFVPW